MKTTTRILSGIALLAALTACSKKDSEAHYQSAQQFLASQEYNAAVIELRSAIQQSPDEYRYRLALGKALLGIGDTASAERELERALRYGAAEEDTALALMQAYYLSGNHQAAISAFERTDELSERTAALVDSYRALAEIELGDGPSGLLHFERLSQSAHVDIATLAQAHLKLSAQEPAEALTLLSSISADSELYAESLYLSGKVHLAQNDPPAAIDQLSQYVALAPSKLLARLLLAQASIQDGQFDASEPHLKLLLQLFPEQPMANYLQSLVSFQRNDFEAAKTHSERAIRHGLVGTRARVIAAISSTQLGLEEQALRHLEPIRNQLHEIPEAQRLYALLQLRAGETDDAANILATLPEHEQNLQLIASTAFELVRRGAPDSARQLLSQYQGELDASGLATIGTVKLGIEGQREAGIRDLEQALALDPSITQTRMVLAMSYLQQGEHDKAAALAEKWIQDPEMQVAGYNLQAYAQFLQQNFDNAMQLTEKALQLKPLNPFSSLLQAMVHVQQRDLTKASQQLKAMLDQHPEYLAGQEQYYAIARALQDTSDATARIDRLHRQNKEVYPVRLLRARVAYDQQDFQQVVTLLQGLSLPSQQLPATHHLLLIESFLRLGRPADAVQKAERWHRQQPDNLQAGYALASALSMNNQQEQALEVFNTLLKQVPGEPQLLIAQMTLLAQMQRLDQAMAVLNNIPEALSQHPQMLFVRGRLELMRNNPAASKRAFQQSYAQEPTHETALFIAVNLTSTESEQSALAFIDQHRQQHGSDDGLNTYHATLLLHSDSTQAKQVYQELLENEPNNIIALNNYAWLLTVANQAEQARPYAKRALELLPNHPDIIDTYGKVLLQLGQPQEALQHFEQSLSIRPDHPEVMLNYAEALLKTNQQPKAKQVLAGVRSDDPIILERLATLQNQLH